MSRLRTVADSNCLSLLRTDPKRNLTDDFHHGLLAQLAGLFGCCIGDSHDSVSRLDIPGDPTEDDPPQLEPCGVGDIDCTYSPIIVPLTNAQAFKLTSAAEGVLYDLNGDGMQEQVGWTAADSQLAFLAMDRNGNGRIDNGKELFGESAHAADCATRRPPAYSTDALARLSAAGDSCVRLSVSLSRQVAKAAGGGADPSANRVATFEALSVDLGPNPHKTNNLGGARHDISPEREGLKLFLF